MGNTCYKNCDAELSNRFGYNMRPPIKRYEIIHIKDIVIDKVEILVIDDLFF